MRKLSPITVIGFFSRRKRNQTERLETVLRDKQALRRNLVRRIDTAEMFVADKREAHEQLVLDGASDQALGRAKAATHAAEDRARTLRTALMQLEEQIVEIERELHAAAERRYRDTMADWLEARAAAIARAGSGYDVGSAALIEAVTRGAVALPEVSSLAENLEAMRREVGTAVDRISAELRTAALRARSGEAKIAFQAPPSSPHEIGPEAISASSPSSASMTVEEGSDASDTPESESSKRSLEQGVASKIIKHDAAA